MPTTRLHYSANFTVGKTASCEDKGTVSRQKGAHKGAKAAEVEAVGATAQGGEARVAGEKWAGRAGRLDLSALEGLTCDFVTLHIGVKLSVTEAIRSHELMKGVATVTIKAFLRPLRLALEE
ncbi:60S ribosomal protein L12 [Babesia caballi]|uniref:60S ribosomal protein L12 n=1 Tax=Babesia caballi TaxID=5871 RepID=A0AAV4LTA4_BABCB|nr:60S ribosomal protein L12 [Babesia caballi]